jgi:protein-disulfide isomerase
MVNMKLCALALAALLGALPAFAASTTTAKGRGYGNPSAPLLIELYSDLECPACKVFHEKFLPQLMREYVDTGKVYLMDYIMSNHAHSVEASGYAFAAARIGKYNEVANALFFRQPEWSANGKVWDVVAAVLSPAEQAKVKALAKDPGVIAQIKAENDLGRTKIERTPTMLVLRGMKQYHFEGSPPWDIFSGFLNELLAKQ